MKSNSIYNLSLALTTLLLASRAHGQSTFVYDQESVTSDALSGVVEGIQELSPVGQSFTPSLQAVGFIRLDIGNGGPPPGSAATFYLNLMSDSINGAVVGSTDPVIIQPNTSSPSNFFFSSPVSVTPGQTYYFDVIEQSGDNTWAISADQGYFYPGGTAFFNGGAAPLYDLWFREGIVNTPEPSSVALLLLGGGAFVLNHRLKAKAALD
jgi:hypothetical protein